MARLTARDIRRFEQRLHTRRRELLDAIGARVSETERNDFTELLGRVRDSGEESVAEFFASANLTMLDREVNELRDVEAALARIAAGTYGKCEECGGDIDKARLEAYPTATRCVECERRREIGRAGGRDITPSL
ncbi:MAG TPA: TraR/DksA C4-type zinc finger protein [Burkholderiales bacterium]